MARKMAAGVNVRSLGTIRDEEMSTLLAHRWSLVLSINDFFS
jgi:hypothetical protein